MADAEFVLQPVSLLDHTDINPFRTPAPSSRQIICTTLSTAQPVHRNYHSYRSLIEAMARFLFHLIRPPDCLLSSQGVVETPSDASRVRRFGSSVQPRQRGHFFGRLLGGVAQDEVRRPFVCQSRPDTVVSLPGVSRSTLVRLAFMLRSAHGSYYRTPLALGLFCHITFSSSYLTPA